LTQHAELLERVADALFQQGLYEKAGFFYEKLNLNERALESFRKGHAYRAAVELCRSVYPAKVVELEGVRSQFCGMLLIVTRSGQSGLSVLVK
jgi:intraflagellar transport protein 172